MDNLSSSEHRRRRICIATALPTIAAGLAAGSVFILTTLYISFNYFGARTASAERAQTITAAIAPYTAWHENARLDHYLRTDARGIAAVTDEDGNFIAGNKDVMSRSNTRTYPIEWHGDLVGTLVTQPQVPFKPAVPLWLFAMIGLAVNLAAISVSRIYSERISKHINALVGYADKIKVNSEPPMPGLVEFAELSRLRVAIGRAVQRSTRETIRLRKIAYRDGLTGLPSQARLLEVMDRVLQSSTYESPAAFIYLDIEGYRRACEMLGGINGQQLLKKIASRLSDQIDVLHRRGSVAGTRHMLASLQGEGFGLFLPHITDRQDVSMLVRSLSQSLARPFDVEGRIISVNVSGGIALAPEDGDVPDELIRHADIALHQIRKTGKPGFQFFTPRLDRQIQGRFRLESELMAAVDNEEFVAVYQPKIDFRSGRIVGAEALARWKRPSGKIISPGAFIPLAEEIGLIEDIGRQILNAACKSAVSWMRAGYDTSVAVNVSPRQFKQDNFTDSVIDALKTAGLPPKRLELEITESMAVSNPGQVTEIMRPLRAMGVRLAIDDFGTGHSNLSMLTQLPFDVFKIDRQFVSTLQSDRQAPAIVEMILAMAETLELETVAEGVETPLQADFLRRRGCTLAQGFHYSPGVAQAEFLSMLRKWDSGFGQSEARAAS